MIRSLLIIRHPCIQMQMLHLRLNAFRARTNHPFANIHMIQLLAVHVVQVRIALCGRCADDVVEIMEGVVGLRDEGLQGVGEGEGVEVAGNEEFGVRNGG